MSNDINENSVKKILRPTVKAQVKKIAREVASEYEGWEYVVGAEYFKNKTLKHTELHIHPSFTYSYGTNVLSQPAYAIKNKKVGKLLKRYGFESYNNYYTWGYSFIEPGKPDNFTISQRFYDYDDIKYDNYGKSISELKDFLRGLMDEGIALLPQKFDLSSEEGVFNSFHETFKYQRPQLAVIICIGKVLLGEFEFVERFYRGEIADEKKFDKERIKKIVDDLPNLKAMWEEHNRIVL